MPRIFIAVEMPPSVGEAIAHHAATLRRQHPSISVAWVNPANIHLTLAFLGQVDSARVVSVSDAAERAAGEWPPFEIEVAGRGCFPANGAPRVLWIGIRDCQMRLVCLQDEIDTGLIGTGFAHGHKPFHPHLTIGRLKNSTGAKEIGRAHRAMLFATQRMRVEELVVFESELSPRGAVHTAVSRHPLPCG